VPSPASIEAPSTPASVTGSAGGRASSTIHGHAKASVTGLGLAALGVVFGDIGTSPLGLMSTPEPVDATAKIATMGWRG